MSHPRWPLGASLGSHKLLTPHCEYLYYIVSQEYLNLQREKWEEGNGEASEMNDLRWHDSTVANFAVWGFSRITLYRHSHISPMFKANPTGLLKKSCLRQNFSRNLHLGHFDLEIWTSRMRVKGTPILIYQIPFDCTSFWIGAMFQNTLLCFLYGYQTSLCVCVCEEWICVVCERDRDTRRKGHV